MTKPRLARYPEDLKHRNRLGHTGKNMRMRSVGSYCRIIFSLACCIGISDHARARDLATVPLWVNAQDQRQQESGIEKLFDDLKAAKNSDDAERISDRLYSRFRQSGSATIDLLATRAREAIAKGDLPVAIEMLSRITKLEPSWAEAWNLRATAFFMMRDFELAKSDIVEALAREPRHIGALTGLALIFETQDQPREALKVYRRILDLAPELKPIKSSAERLARQIERPM